MQVIERSAIVPFSAAQMFALVNDVGRYPEFLPWCTGARVVDESDHQRLASVSIARGPLRTEFTTRNTLTTDALIVMHLVEGPFRELEGVWRFDPLAEGGSRIAFRVKFEFKSRLTALALGVAFEALCGNIVEAFATRAQRIHG